MSNNSNEPKKKSFLSLLFAKCFGGKKTMSVFEEEQMQSPGRTIVKNFKSNKLAMTGLIVFLLMFLTAFIGPLIFKIDLSYSESTQLNVSPGYTLMKYPSALKGNVKEISVGPTFSVGVSNDGTLYTWGKTKITNTLNLANIPDEYQGLDYKRISAGFDHILGLPKLMELSGAPLYMHEYEAALLNDKEFNLTKYFRADLPEIRVDKKLSDGDILFLGKEEIKVIHTPGHTVGGLSFLDGDVLISGDTLFEGSIGKIDHPTGDMELEIRTIKEKLLVLPDETKVFPGHGEMTTIGRERKENMFLI